MKTITFSYWPLNQINSSALRRIQELQQVSPKGPVNADLRALLAEWELTLDQIPTANF